MTGQRPELLQQRNTSDRETLARETSFICKWTTVRGTKARTCVATTFAGDVRRGIFKRQNISAARREPGGKGRGDSLSDQITAIAMLHALTYANSVFHWLAV